MIDQEDIRVVAAALPYFKRLSAGEQEIYIDKMRKETFEKGENIHSGERDCEGLMIVKSGRLRVYIISDTGREATLFRPVPGEVCVFTASCVMRNIDFEVIIDAEEESEVLILPAQNYQEIMQTSQEAADFTNQVIAARFSDVMWVMEQILFTSLDKRLALFLTQQAQSEKKDVLTITHETIAGHLGSAREVITRMLKYFEREGMIEVFRGGIRILDLEGLKRTAGIL
jgi:CRP/FNR family transcriptional regulator